MNGTSISTRNDASSKVFQHGGINTADRKVDYREVTLDIILTGEDQRDYRNKVDTLKAYLFRQGQKLFLDDERYINISSLSSIDETFYDGFYMVRSNLSVTLLALDPFFYDVYDQRQTLDVTTNPQSININNPGNADSPMTISITANEAIDNFSLKNVTDNGRLMTYSDANFTTGKTLVVSNLDGTVTLAGTSTINNFSGTFLSLLAGNNTLTWTGGKCAIQIDFPVRWL